MPDLTAATYPTIYAELRPVILRSLTLHLRGDWARAEDLAQEASLKAWRALAGGTVIPASGASAWLSRIVRNTLIDDRRRAKLVDWQSLEGLIDAGRDIGDPVGTLDGVGIRECITAVLATLPDHYRQALLLSATGATCREGAEHFACSESSYKMRVMRGRQKFIAQYQEVA